MKIWDLQRQIYLPLMYLVKMTSFYSGKNKSDTKEKDGMKCLMVLEE